jgi:serine/threonine protein kinase/WD40 repeat protein
MASEPDDDLDSADDERFAAAVEEYYRRRALGPVDTAAFAREFPDIQADLEAFFATVADVGRLAPTLGYTSAPAPTPPLDVIRYFGEYELLSEVARGGMGVVYRARQSRLDRIVAVKMILAGRLASEQDVARFRQEASGAAKLHHPNVVTIYEIGEHEGQHFFSMEFVEGSNLAQLLKDNPVGAVRAAEYVRTIAETMDAIHREGLLHRDLKPSNVLVEARSGMLRITDFGLVKSIDTDTMFTTTGQVLGTPSYMAPEQAAGHNDLVGPHSDIYSIGAILYELSTGRPPFLGDTPWDTAWQVQHLEVVAPVALNPKIPRDLETVCLKCLQKDPARRYATAQALADDLGRFLRHEPIHARPVSRFERTWRWCRRNPALTSALAAAAIGFLALLVSLAVFGDTQRKNAKTLADALDVSEDRRRESNLRLAETERDKGLRLCAQGDVDQGCLWLAQSLATAPEDAADLCWSIRINLAAWQRELCTLEAIFPGAQGPPRFSRDSERFALSGIAEKLDQVYETATAKPISVPLRHSGRGADLTFGDRRTLLARHGSMSLWREADGKWTEQPLAGNKAGGYRTSQITADNRVIVTESTASGVIVRELVSNEQLGKLLPSNPYEPGEIAISADGRFALTHTDRKRSILSDVLTGKAIGDPLLHPNRVTGAVFSPDGTRLVTGYKRPIDKNHDVAEVQVWDTATGAKIGGPLPHEGDDMDPEALLYSADGERLFTCTRYGRVRVWDRQGKLIAGPLEHQCDGKQVYISDDGRLLSFISPSREARLWDVDKQQVVGQPLAQMGTIHDATLSPDGRHLLTGTPNEARLWKTPSRGWLTAPIRHGSGDKERVWLALSKNGQRMVSVSVNEGTLQMWDVRTAKAIGAPWKPRYPANGLAISSDGRLVATGTGQIFSGRKIPCAYLWDSSTGQLPGKAVPEYQEMTHAIAFTNDGKRLVTLGDRGKIYLYDIAKDAIVAGPLMHPMKPHDGQRLQMAISPDDRTLAVFAEYDDRVSLWDLRTNKMTCEPLEVKEFSRAVAFSPDSKLLAVVGDRITLWNVPGGAQTPARISSPADALAVAFSPDGALLATAHEDRTARVWLVSTGKRGAPSMEHLEIPHRLAFAAGGKLLVTRTMAGPHVWDLFSATPVGPALRTSISAEVSEDGRLLVTTEGNQIRMWQVPQPTSDDAITVMRKIEDATAKKLDNDRLIQPLTTEEWNKQHQR